MWLMCEKNNGRNLTRIFLLRKKHVEKFHQFNSEAEIVSFIGL